MYPLHVDHLLQLRESKTSEQLGEDVRELSTSFDEFDDDLPFIDTVPEEVELHVDVLAPIVENRILREDDGEERGAGAPIGSAPPTICGLVGASGYRLTPPPSSPALHDKTVSNRLPKPRPIHILGSAQCFYV